ncbi:MAG TPA: DUF2007 domain-containing protein [Kofleriaceae bacterium]|jgi:hypothetical protein|nr:DUF2007 domain-containing protein [Kofleriaceae bacterium]
MKHRVKIGTCSGPAEAAFVRSVFDAHELPVVINGEMHASTMGGLGGFVRLDIFVDSEDAEDAAALLRDIRTGDHAVSEDDELPDGDHARPEGDEVPDGPESDERADAEGVWNARRATGALAISPAARAAVPTTGFDFRRRRTGIILLLSVMAGFGTAHMATGAWGRGVLLAALHVVGIAYVVNGQAVLGGWLLFGARFGDLFGALWRVWAQPRGDMAA